ncbi:hypothetical protein GWI33_015460, partial [Rhynchophorus ferrugineus]
VMVLVENVTGVYEKKCFIEFELR